VIVEEAREEMELDSTTILELEAGHQYGKKETCGEMEWFEGIISGIIDRVIE
jgi:hypothetical protein